MQLGNGACRFRAKTEIGAHMHRIRRASTERRIHERHGRLRGKRRGERQNHDTIDARIGKRFHALLVGHELLQAIGMKTLIGVDIEREDNRLAAAFRSSALRLVDKEPMPPMHAIEHAECAGSANKQCMVE